MTPPVAAKITPEPVAVPNGSSKSLFGRLGTCSPASLNILPSSRVVSPKSTSLKPESCISGRLHSNFLAEHGMSAQLTMLAGSRPIFSA
jgi:hypothetical protein